MTDGESRVDDVTNMYYGKLAHFLTVTLEQTLYRGNYDSKNVALTKHRLRIMLN